MKNRILLVANWKMNVNTEEAALNLFNSIKNVLARNTTTEMIVCPPHMYLNQIKREVISEHYNVGAQDAFHLEEGNFTGETSISMVKDAGAKYVILGHSDRRKIETYSDVAPKVTAALHNEINPIICIGETEAGKNWKKEIQQQLKDVFNRVPKGKPEKITIAYCPVWAISGEKRTPASSSHYNEAIELIKKEIHKLFKTLKAVESIRYIYGGSLDDKNIEEYLKNTDVEGFIVGRVSHDPRILMTMFRLITEGVELRKKALREAELNAE
jgi:triosephosphate isomerase